MRDTLIIQDRCYVHTEYDYESGPKYEIGIGEYWGFSEVLYKENPEACGFGRMLKM